MWPFRREVVRTCRHCGTAWRVPARVAKGRRPNHWRVGVSPLDRHGLGGLPFDAAVAEQLAAAQRRNRSAQHDLDLVARFEHCPECDSTDCTQSRRS